MISSAMRKLDPEGIRTDFDSALDDVKSATDAVLAAKVNRTTKKLITESAMLTAAVLWEGFLSDLFIAYINRDTSAYAMFAEAAVRQHAQEKFGTDVVKSVSLQLELHLSADQVRQLLDSKGYNLTFKTASFLVHRAGEWLAKPYKQYFTALTPAQRASIDASSAIRNFLAHRSRSSKGEMAKALVVADLPRNLGRGTNDVHDIGAFLLSTPVRAKTTRFALYVTNLKALAAGLCP